MQQNSTCFGRSRCHPQGGNAKDNN